MDVSRAALHRVITTVGRLYEPGDPPFPERVLAVVRGLIGADSCSYNDIAAPTRALGWRVEPAGVGEFPDAAAVFTAHLPEHPLLAHYQATGDGAATRISDICSDRQFRALGIYREFYRHAEVNHQLAITIAANGGGVLGVALNRHHREFTDTDRDLLELLRPHIARAHTLTRALDDRTAAGPIPSAADGSGDPGRLLTVREHQVIALLAAGHDDRAIARRLQLSPRTVHTHLRHIYRKLEVTSRTAALARLATNPAPPTPATPSKALATPTDSPPSPAP